MTDEALQQLVAQLSQHYFQQPFCHRATFNPRLRTTGGRYHLTTHNIDINPRLLLLPRETLVQVIKHELCHYHLHRQGRGYRHRDRDFRELLQAVGGTRFVDGGTYVSRHKWQYQCTVCQQLYYRQRRLDVSKYRCGRCGSPLSLQTNQVSR